MNDFLETIKSVEWSSFTPIFINIFAAIAVLIIGWVFAGWAERLVRRRLGNSKGLEVDDTIRPLLAMVVRYGVVLATMYAALKVSGFPAAPLLAVFGAAGLAIALAAQGTLANVAAGLMLIFLRSIRVGEYIQASSVEGTVLEIGLFTTEIKTSDGVFITAPNAQIWASQIKNYSRYKTRRIDIDIEIGRDNDLAQALAVLQKTLENHAMVIVPDKAETVIAGFTPTSVKLQARCWLKAADLRTSASSIRLALHETLQTKGFKLPPVPFG